VLPCPVVRAREGRTRRFAGLIVAGATIVACSELAGINDAKTIDESVPEPDRTENPPVRPGDDQRTDESIVISPAEIDFGDVPCQTEAVAKLISIHNKSTAATSYKVVIPDGTAFRIDGALEGSVPAGGVVTLRVFAKPGTAGANTTDLVISAGNAVQTIHPKARGTGATMELLPTLVSFGDVRMQSGGGPIDVEVVNRGTAPITFSAFETSAEFAVALGVPQLRIDPEGKAIVKATLKPGVESAAPLQAILKPVLTQTLCGQPPVLTLTGKRVNSSVTLSSGDFGRQNCTANPSREITVSNYSPSLLTYTASLAAVTAFTITSGASGSLAAGNTNTPTLAKITVQAKPFGTNLTPIAEDLTVNIVGIAAPEGGMRKVPLKVDVRGAIVTFTPQEIRNFTSDGVTTDTKTFNALNTGNEPIYLYWIFARTAGGAAWTYNPPSSISPAQTRSGVVGFKPTTQGLNEARLTPFRGTNIYGGGGVSCTPLNAIVLQGTKP
jgi:hypothetical protein